MIVGAPFDDEPINAGSVSVIDLAPAPGVPAVGRLGLVVAILAMTIAGAWRILIWNPTHSRPR